MIVLLAALGGCRFAGGGSSTKESLNTAPGPVVPQWAKDEGFAENRTAVAGAEIFVRVGCLQCHMYLGTGATSLGARDLSAIGKDSPRGVEGFAAYIAEPPKFGNNVMPNFKDLGRTRLSDLGAFLEASKGRR